MMWAPNDVRTAVIAGHTAESTPATGTHTVTDGTGTAEADVTIEAGLPAEGNTLTVNASTVQLDGVAGPTVVFTFTATPTLPNHVEIGVDATTTAQNLEDAIEDVANGLVPDYIASADNTAGVCTIVAAAEGRKGNAIALTKVGANITLESAALTGGTGSAANNDTATIGETEFVWKLLPTLATHVEIGNTAEACADNLLAAVEAHPTSGALVTGVSANRVVTWTAIAEDTSGNDIALAEAGDSSAVSGAEMSGGVDPLIAAPGTGKKILVVAVDLTLDANGEVTFKGGTAGNTALSGAMELLADTPFVLPYQEVGWYEGAHNAQINVLATTAANGTIRYVLAASGPAT